MKHEMQMLGCTAPVVLYPSCSLSGGDLVVARSSPRDCRQKEEKLASLVNQAEAGRRAVFKRGVYRILSR